MKNKLCLLKICIFTLSTYTCKAQQFLNGGLEGVAAGISILPPNWQNVPFDDINCQATHVGWATPDLTDTIDISASSGIMGRPYSGLTFVSGMYGGDTANSFFQEGIMQNVTGFEINHVYVINFHQSVVKQDNALDKSGAWAVYIDTILAGITASTNSEIAYNNIALTWDSRSITFTATATSHLIKFLPVDDDLDGNFSTSNTNGALRMGIDNIYLNSATGIKLNGAQSIVLEQNVPNPFAEQTSITYYLPDNVTRAQILFFEQSGKIIKTVDLTGKGKGQLNVFANDLTNGVYTYTLVVDDKIIETKKMLKQ